MKQPRQLSASLIGQRLIEAGYLTKEQLKEALAEQANTGLLLGEVCLLRGWVNYRELKACLPELTSKLGDKLLKLGYLSMEQLWLALLEQRHTGYKLGEILVGRGWMDINTLNQILEEE